MKLWQKVDVVFFDEDVIINSMQPSAFAIDKFHYTLEREYTSASINVLVTIRSFNEQGNGTCSLYFKNRTYGLRQILRPQKKFD